MSISTNWSSFNTSQPSNLSNNFILNPPKIPYSYYQAILPSLTSSQVNTGNLMTPQAISTLGGMAFDQLSSRVFGDSEVGSALGQIFSQAGNSATNTIADNLLKGNALTYGLGQNVGSSVAGVGAGIAANYLGKGISSAFGNTKVGKGVGAGVASLAGTAGGSAMLALTTGTSLVSNLGKINPIGAVTGAIGAGLLTGFGPSKEYWGKYGKITLGGDIAYDLIQTGANFIPVAGNLVSGLMALNKGLMNVFGSTDGMTVLDAIMGTPLLSPFFMKWINMAGAKTTSTFNNQSWQNTEKADSFMLNAFGNLQEKFDKAREEAGKTYGTFSRNAYHRALDNINFANRAWGQILGMADLNKVQNIRSLLMSSINNQRYAQDIQGGWTPLARGKQGMKIFNNATNHKIGMRLLSGAALVDSKQIILCSAVD